MGFETTLARLAFAPGPGLRMGLRRERTKRGFTFAWSDRGSRLRRGREGMGKSAPRSPTARWTFL